MASGARGIFCSPFYFLVGEPKCVTLSSIGKSLDVSSVAVEMPYSSGRMFAAWRHFTGWTV